MVLKIFSNNSVFVYKDIDMTFFQTHSYGGMKHLQFDVSIKHGLYKYMVEETRLEYDEQYYLIKGINERTSSGICTVNAELDLTGLESKVYISKTWTEESFVAFTSDILSGTGWSITNAILIGKRTTTEAKDETPLKLLNRCSNNTSYGACFEFDTKNKTITCIKPENITTPSGVYFTDELNLTELTVKGSSSSLVTRLYPIGKDGLTIKSVNNNQNYIENHTYTDKVICGVWRDERYTSAQSLMDDAVVKLAALAVPERAYTCNVINLAKTNPDTYGSILPINLYDIVTLIDRNRGTRIDHRIVELREYPADHTLDTVALSTVAGRISGTITKINSRIIELDAQQMHDRSKVNEIKQDMDTTVLHISESWASAENSSMITQTSTGLYFDVDRAVGQNQWGTKLQQSAIDVQIAWNNITKKIQFTGGELRIYDTALTSSQQLRSKFNEDGSHFYRDGNYVGKIGTNKWSNYIPLSSRPSNWDTQYSDYYIKSGTDYIRVTGDTAPPFTPNAYYQFESSHKGLVLDLNHDGKYMAFAQKESADSNYYTTMLCFSRVNSIYNDYGLHLGCDFYGHYNTIHNVYLDGVSVIYNGEQRQSFTGAIKVMTDDSGSYTYLRVSNGIIVGYWT